jgi:D-apionolactonase
MPPLPKNILYYGAEAALPEQVEFQAGPLSVLFEGGDLRYIRYGDREVVRRIYVAVRDRNWGTVPPRLSNLKIERTAASFQITYDCQHQQGGIDFFWKATIRGEANGSIRFAMDGEARSTFQRNRIGFCVLHPIRECAGVPCRVEKVNGAVEKAMFPKRISPHQPFKDIRAVSHEVVPGLEAEVRFTGETFEIEDHRNWTDASYKIYGTPLALPFPVEVKQGTKVSQSVTISLKGTPSAPKRTAATETLNFAVGRSVSHPLPRVGLGAASHGEPLSAREIERLKVLELAHLRVDLVLSRPEYPARLRQAAADARNLGIPLESAVFVSDAAASELAAFKTLLAEVKPAVSTWLVFHTTEPTVSEKWARLAREALASHAPKARVGGGSNQYFTEINRFHPPVKVLDLVSYSINPQVHSFDIPALVENLEAQAMTVESARAIIDNRLLAISPVTLRPRFSASATGPELATPPGTLPFAVDPRQMSLFGAGWTAGSLKYLSESGVASVTYYETSGWRGVVEQGKGSPEPALFRSIAGGVFPLYHVLADFGEFAGGAVIPSKSSDPLRIDGVVLHKDHKNRLLLANLSPQSQAVKVNALGATVRVRMLDERNAEEAMTSPEMFRRQQGEEEKTTNGGLEVKLLPFGIARLDWM